MKTALISMNQLWEDKTGNLELCGEHIRNASSAGADLVIFPEMTLTGFTMNTALSAEDEDSSLTVDAFKGLAVKNCMDIIFGCVFKAGKKAVNAMVYVDSSGAVQGIYKKIHPFSYAGEDKFFSGGDELVSVKRGGLRLGFAVCYDLRFPELFTAQNKENDVIVVIANWPASRITHWNALLTARAIENQIQIAGVNRTGTDGKGLEYVESSKLIHPYGSECEPLLTSGEMKLYDINPAETAENREKFRFLQDRKPDCYREII
ncbi:MAG: nitrilase-related carbon-nitrogen hydrolase [Deferribacterales bacterium]